MGLAAVPPAFMGARHLQTSFTASAFQPGEASSEKQAARFEKSLLQNAREFPSSFQVAYVSGHGSHKAVAGFSPQVLGNLFDETAVDLTVLDACSTGQLEVLSKLGAGAGQVLCSSQPVPGKGFPIDRLFKESADIPAAAFEVACTSTSSLSLVDNRRLESHLLPALDSLAKGLSDSWPEHRDSVKKALAQSRCPDLVGPRVDLRSFLDNLGKAALDPATQDSLESCRQSLSETLRRDTGGLSLSFRLDGKENEKLPEGWNRLIRKLDLPFKPLAFPFVTI
jgi:hypothetical protein